MSYGFQVKGLGRVLQFIHGVKWVFGCGVNRKGVYFRGANATQRFVLLTLTKLYFPSMR